VWPGYDAQDSQQEHEKRKNREQESVGDLAGPAKDIVFIDPMPYPHGQLPYC
jgi:hypothetical protein